MEEKKLIEEIGFRLEHFFMGRKGFCESKKGSLTKDADVRVHLEHSEPHYYCSFHKTGKAWIID